MTAFSIDLAIGNRIVPINEMEVLEYDSDDLAAELAEWGVESPRDLSDWDRMVFVSEIEGEAFMAQYKAIYKALGKLCVCIDRKLPSLAYRKRHLVGGLMGLKMKTARTYRKDWKSGQLFNLHDRTNFLTVRLKEIKKVANEYEYHFELP